MLDLSSPTASTKLGGAYVLNMGVGDKIEWTGASFSPVTHMKLIPNAGQGNDRLELLNSSNSILYQIVHFSLASNVKPSQLVVSSGVNGGPGVTLQVVCFAAGTRVATSDGEVAVEALRAGDAVRTLAADGSAAVRPVRWIGERRIDLTRHPEPALVAAVRTNLEASLSWRTARGGTGSRPSFIRLPAADRTEKRQQQASRSTPAETCMAPPARAERTDSGWCSNFRRAHTADGPKPFCITFKALPMEQYPWAK